MHEPDSFTKLAMEGSESQAKGMRNTQNKPNGGHSYVKHSAAIRLLTEYCCTFCYYTKTGDGADGKFPCPCEPYVGVCQGSPVLPLPNGESECESQSDCECIDRMRPNCCGLPPDCVIKKCMPAPLVSAAFFVGFFHVCSRCVCFC